MPKKRKARALPASTVICLQIVGQKYKQLEGVVGRRFRHRALLAQAVIHRSCHIEIGGAAFIQSNERLEQLGDRVLGLVLCDYLHKKYPDKSEDFVAQILGTVLSNRFLAEVAGTMGLFELIVAGKYSQALKAPAARQNILADTMEAVIGAIYSDGGLKAVEGFLRRVMCPHVGKFIETALSEQKKTVATPKPKAEVSAQLPGPRTRLMQLLHSRGKGSPRYMEEATGDEAAPLKVSIFAKDELLGEAAGKMPRQTRDAAAVAALKKLGA